MERVTSLKFNWTPRMLSLTSPANLTRLPPQLSGPVPTDLYVMMPVGSNLLIKRQSRRLPNQGSGSCHLGLWTYLRNCPVFKKGSEPCMFQDLNLYTMRNLWQSLKNRKERMSEWGGRAKEENVDEKEPELEAGCLTAQCSFAGLVRFNWFQVSTEPLCLPHRKVARGKPDLFTHSAMWLRVLGPSYFLPLLILCVSLTV